MKTTDQLDPARALAMHNVLSRPGTPPTSGEPLPPFWHHIYFWDPHPDRDLGPDSHLRPGIGLIPDLGLPQRMWAGGRLEFLEPLVLGQHAARTSAITNVQVKQGKSGKLAFVTVTHEIRQGDTLCVRENQDLVYKDYPEPCNIRHFEPARTDSKTSIEHSFSTTLLFQYSALTFNAHRIHYDQDYARYVEGYPGLVVHGPLLAQYLVDLATERLGQLNTFAFRAVSPLMHFETATLSWKAGELWISGPDGRVCMEATAS